MTPTAFTLNDTIPLRRPRPPTELSSPAPWIAPQPWFSYAFGRWAPLTDVRGNAVTTGAIADAQVYKVFEISGVDRVLFLADDADHANNFLMAACSTV